MEITLPREQLLEIYDKELHKLKEIAQFAPHCRNALFNCFALMPESHNQLARARRLTEKLCKMIDTLEGVK